MLMNDPICAIFLKVGDQAFKILHPTTTNRREMMADPIIADQQPLMTIQMKNDNPDDGSG